MAAAARRNAAAEISGHVDLRAVERGRPRHARGASSRTTRAEERKHPLGVVAGRDGLVHDGRSRGLDPRRGARLDLRARDARVHVRAVERPAAHDDGRQAVPARARTSAPSARSASERDRPAPAERGVAGQHREEALRREKSRRQPERGPRVLRVEDRLALAQGAPGSSILRATRGRARRARGPARSAARSSDAPGFAPFVSPGDRAPRRIARCVIDLSPGTSVPPRSGRPARRGSLMVPVAGPAPRGRPGASSRWARNPGPLSSMARLKAHLALEQLERGKELRPVQLEDLRPELGRGARHAGRVAQLGSRRLGERARHRAGAAERPHERDRGGVRKVAGQRDERIVERRRDRPGRAPIEVHSAAARPAAVPASMGSPISTAAPR